MSTTNVSYIAHKFPLRFMYTEEWQKIKTKVPLDLWKKVEVLGFDSTDKAVVNAFEKLVSDPELNIYGKEQEIRIQELKNRLEDEQKRNQELQSKTQEMEKRLEDGQRRDQELQSKTQEMEKRLEDEQRRNQGLQRELELRMEEAQKQIKDLQKELEKAERREIYFEEMHNNYMMQVQTLINQKQIVAPGAKKPWWRFW
jgi:chromosome segregation ATPase